MMEYENEPIRGLPGDLPAGEHILWQGAPDWRTFARSALFTRWIGLYFVFLTALAFTSGSFGGALVTGASGLIALLLLWGFAWGVARTTVYTITNRRVVLRIGVALNKCINLPLKVIGSANLRPQAAGFGDIALSLTEKHRLGYAVLWPHARPLHFSKPEPMLRALADAEQAAEILAKACAAVVPNTPGEAPAEKSAPMPPLKGAPA